MNRRVSFLSFIVVLAGTGALIATTAQSQLGLPKAYVGLQPNTPGTSQSGHANISGTMRAGQFVGGGSGLSNLSASDISSGTLSPARLPIPLTLSGSNSNYILNVQNSSSGTFATAINCLATATSGTTTAGYFENASTSGMAIWGYAFTGSGNTIGGRFDSGSPNGTGALGIADQSGVEGTTYSTTGRGVLGFANSNTGDNVGVLGFTNSSTGKGVYGYSLISTGVNYGVFGSTASAAGRGVFGQATNSTGTTFGGRFETDSDTGRGVLGFASSTTGANYGVRGQSNSSSGYGVYAVGDMGASGVKSFRIDHPFDPENKYLLHYSTESPVPQNFYVGNAVTDARGRAWVELPDYFGEINANFKYQLTVIDDTGSPIFAQVKIGREIRENRFLILSSVPNVKVSWRVDADRNDLYVRDREISDVVEKEGPERGKYQHPELYGQPKERGMDYQPRVLSLAPRHSSAARPSNR